jgi:hypothetical protein
LIEATLNYGATLTKKNACVLFDFPLFVSFLDLQKGKKKGEPPSGSRGESSQAAPLLRRRNPSFSQPFFSVQRYNVTSAIHYHLQKKANLLLAAVASPSVRRQLPQKGRKKETASSSSSPFKRDLLLPGACLLACFHSHNSLRERKGKKKRQSY